MFLVYISFSEKLQKFYISMTADFDVRLDFHLNDIQQLKFTHNAKDWVLFHKIDCETKELVSKIERNIKSMKSKIYIEYLTKYPEIIIKLFNKYSTAI